ncbi:hypothetical protein A5802_003057 [Enterococcus mundtii]|uniref:Uncharacterized protein n=1 Tax=Enterococcus mundtii TaxID=53346 RepID=A0A242KU42_ENTMU|nr:hypothetical protein A5802_003057 [Enterococcus mundtii]
MALRQVVLVSLNGSSTSSVGEFKLEEFHRESIEAEIGFD